MTGEENDRGGESDTPLPIKDGMRIKPSQLGIAQAALVSLGCECVEHKKPAGRHAHNKGPHVSIFIMKDGHRIGSIASLYEGSRYSYMAILFESEHREAWQHMLPEFERKLRELDSKRAGDGALRR